MSISMTQNVLNAFCLLREFSDAVKSNHWVKVEKLEKLQAIKVPVFDKPPSGLTRKKSFQKFYCKQIRWKFAETKPNHGSSLREVRDFVESQILAIAGYFKRLPIGDGELPNELRFYKSHIIFSMKTINSKIEEHNKKIDDAFSGETVFSKIRRAVYSVLYFTTDFDSIKKRLKVDLIVDRKSFYRLKYLKETFFKKFSPATLEAVLMLPQGEKNAQLIRGSLDEMLTFFKEKMGELDSLSPEQAASLEGIGELLAQHGLLKPGGNIDANPSVSDTPPDAPPTDDVPPPPPTDDEPPAAPPTDEAPASINSTPDWKLKLLEKQRNKPVVGTAGAVPQGGTAQKPSGDDDLMTALRKRLEERNKKMNGGDASSTLPTGSTTTEVVASGEDSDDEFDD